MSIIPRPYSFQSCLVACTAFALFLNLFAETLVAQDTPAKLSPKDIVEKAVAYSRDTSSYLEAKMIVHRPSWERSLEFKAWTKGSKNSLVRFVAPPKDAGNASLTKQGAVYSYSPRINKVVKIPSSMMSQSWMGSDFSYQDLSRADDIVDQYQHSLLSTNEVQGHRIYNIESIPKESAPVVWGKEILLIRDDFITLQHDFYSQDSELIKSLIAKNIELIGGRLYPREIEMQVHDQEGEHWTKVIHKELNFTANISPSTFTLAYLRNPRADSGK